MINEIKFGKFLLKNFSPYKTPQGEMWKRKSLCEEFNDVPKNITIFSTTEVYKIYKSYGKRYS